MKRWGAGWTWTAAIVWALEVCVLLYFAIGKTGFESRLAFGDVSLNMILQLVVLGCVVALPWRSVGGLWESRTLRLLLGFTALLWIGTWNAANEAYAFVKPIGFAAIVLPCMALLVGWVRDAARVRRLLWTWCGLGTAMMAGGVVMLLLGAAPVRLAVAGGGANVFARTVASALLIAVILGTRPRSTGGRLAAGLALAGFAVALLCAGSKTALVGFGLAAMAAAWFVGRKRLAIAGIAATLLFVLSPLVLHRLVQGADKERGTVRVFRLPDTDDPRGSYGTRLQYYQASVRLIGREGLLGVGTGDWATALRLPSGRMYPHNMALELGCEQGIVGLAILGLLVGLGWRWATALRQREGDRRLPAVLFALFVFWLFNAQLSGDLIDNRNVWWPLFLMEIVRMEHSARARQRESAAYATLPPGVAAKGAV